MKIKNKDMLVYLFKKTPPYNRDLTLNKKEFLYFYFLNLTGFFII